MAVNVGSKINVTSTVANIDANYGPYTTLQAAFDALGENGKDCLCIGLTVGIQPTPTSPITEYWFKSACAAVTDLVIKAENAGGTIELIDE